MGDVNGSDIRHLHYRHFQHLTFVVAPLQSCCGNQAGSARPSFLCAVMKVMCNIWVAVFYATQETKPLFSVDPCVIVLSCQFLCLFYSSSLCCVVKYMLMLSLLKGEDSLGFIYLHAGKML